MTPAIAALCLYAGLNGAIALWLTLRVIRVRQAERIGIGDAGNPTLIRRMRGHMNFVETAPLGLILLGALALAGAWALVIHVLGLMLTVGRALHGWHFVQDDAPVWQRMYGMILTLLALMGAASLAVVMGLLGVVRVL